MATYKHRNMPTVNEGEEDGFLAIRRLLPREGVLLPREGVLLRIVLGIVSHRLGSSTLEYREE